MLKFGIVCVLLTALLTAASCRHAGTPHVSRDADSNAEQLSERQAGRLPVGHSLLELERTVRELEAARAALADMRARQQQTEWRAIREVEQGMTLPENYGRTIQITPDMAPLALPPGPMEQLIEQPISLQLSDANVMEMILKLSEFDGLNIIADQELETDRRVTVNLKDVPLKDVLSYIARNMGVEFHITPNVIWVTESAMVDGGGPELVTRIFPLRKGFVPPRQSGGNGVGGGGEDDFELLEALHEVLADSPAGHVLRLFKNRNLLLVKNSAANMRLVEELIQQFDIAPRQVLIEARFLTISQADLHQLGIDIERLSVSRAGPSSLQSLVADSIFPEFTEGAASPSLAVSGILGNHEYEAILRALDKLTDAETLSAPRLTLLNNQTARIRRGSNFYYWEEWEVVSDTILSNGTPTETTDRRSIQPVGRPSEIEQGITLDVTVSIGNDGQTVMLSLVPTIKNVDKLNYFSTGQFRSIDREAAENGSDLQNGDGTVGFFLPEVSESSVDTAVAVQSGETVVLGGILENRTRQELHKVPLLGDLPLAGVLFRRTLTSREPRHLLIFVTGRVVSPSGEYVQITDSVQ